MSQNETSSIEVKILLLNRTVCKLQKKFTKIRESHYIVYNFSN